MNRILIYSLLLAFFICHAVFAYNGKVRRVYSPSTLILSRGNKVKLAGVLPPKNREKRAELMRYLSKKLVGKTIEVKPDTILEKTNQSPKLTLGYVYFQCDTCGVSSTTPEYKGTEIITTHPQIHLNKFLIEEEICEIDLSEDFEKKSYFQFLLYQKKNK